MPTNERPYDIILRNGTLIDGSDQPAFAAELAIRRDRLAELGNLIHARAIRDIDVTGLVVARGFIDVHTHDDASVIARPEMTA